MSARVLMDEHTAEAANGLNQLEGYLLWQAEIAEAQRAAAAFTGRLPWLTTGQREEVAEAYVQAHLRLSRQAVAHIVKRIRQVRSEYEERYHRLKIRIAAVVLATLALAAAVLALLTHVRQAG
ncbi:hypothetical protein LN042_31220 [Kitasatospora sp. RB6PN24]|uniref:hypothetical protein n=1 Tax=Kitasatospora humi TaxID=2893891 RepID=UPI001E28BB61|nr:hypothetical protein [Kitasatospora humi]MCC9311484.1 hypothetical protein [Kitasatospora humi]